MEFKMKDDTFVVQTEFGELPISPNEKHGYRPYQLMVASIVGCSANLLKSILLKMRMDVHRLDITTHIERDEASANKITSMQIHFILKGHDLATAKVKKALALAQKNCGMMRTVENNVHITETFEIIV